MSGRKAQSELDVGQAVRPKRFALMGHTTHVGPMLRICFAFAFLSVASVSVAIADAQQRSVMPQSSSRPMARSGEIPAALWDRVPGGAMWTRATLAALVSHGRPLLEIIPADIADWCPAYAQNDAEARAAFWNGLISTLVKHESTFKPRAVGGGGKWFGLTQILPATARGYKCRARTGEALKNGAENLSCAVRIMSKTVIRDGAVALKNGRRAGVAADWGPMTKSAKRAEMARYLLRQDYCTAPLAGSPRPVLRPSRAKP